MYGDPMFKRKHRNMRTPRVIKWWERDGLVPWKPDVEEEFHAQWAYRMNNAEFFVQFKDFAQEGKHYIGPRNWPDFVTSDGIHEEFGPLLGLNKTRTLAVFRRHTGIRATGAVAIRVPSGKLSYTCHRNKYPLPLPMRRVVRVPLSVVG